MVGSIDENVKTGVLPGFGFQVMIKFSGIGYPSRVVGHPTKILSKYDSISEFLRNKESLMLSKLLERRGTNFLKLNFL